MTPWTALTVGNRPAKADPVLPPASHHHIIYRMEFPPEIRNQLVTFENPDGEINNSDLELADSYLHHEAIVHNYGVRERTISSHADNTPTVYWQRKGAVTSISAPARILRLQALYQRRHRYVPRHDFISGDNNRLADDASRLTHLTGTQFLHYFNTKYPQRSSWRLWTPPSRLQHLLISTVLGSSSTPVYAQAPIAPLPITGDDGARFAPPWPSTPYSHSLKPPSPYSKSSLSAIAPVRSHLAEGKSEHALWRVPYGRLGKRLPVWGPRTHVTTSVTK